MSRRVLKVAMAAGEASGDQLGAGLIAALRRRADVECFGLAGPKMVAAGCDAWYRTEELSVMGYAEVLRHLPRLLKLRRELIARLLERRPDVFVGIDSSHFNLGVAAALKAAGAKTVQYVSPQIWATRQGRVATVRRAVDLVLCVLPFEPPFYERHGVDARFIGHPLADAIPPSVDRAAARAALGLPAEPPLLAVLPGSRRTEVSRLAAPFLATAAWLRARRPALQVAVALVNDAMGRLFAEATREVEAPFAPHLVTGRAREVMAAADVVLTASGTATLEALLLKRPMVVAYRMSASSYWLVQRLGVRRLKHFSLPNLLAGRELVPEFVQGQVRPDVLGPAVERFLDGTPLDPGWYDAFADIHRQLRRGADDRAAEAVLDLVV
ncbi:MAG TPA: lipid-A-disaccharide synthase [Gammaproteobacteria bacterium]